MKPALVRFVTATVVSGLLIALFTLAGDQGHAQDPKSSVAKGGPAATGESFSAQHCVGCHGGKNTPAYEEYKRDETWRPTEFVRLDEHNTWRTEDLHSLAYENIVPAKDKDGRDNLAAHMQQVLQAHRPKDYKVHEAVECLTCHASESAAGRALAVSEKKFEHFQTRYGVGCEACHGYAENWFGPHVQAKTWRTRDPKSKSELGLIDLRDPYTRALTCASCHIGDKSQGRFITHEMYAAGHPPLPPFELVTYCRDQPRHSFTHRENSVLAALAEKDDEKARSLFHYSPPASATKTSGVCPDARDFAVGAVGAFEATMKLLADDAAATDKNGGLLDFAHFDCYACHHDLRIPSDRQARGVPGRPLPRPWASDTLRIVLGNLESADQPKAAETNRQIATELDALNKAFAGRPFGIAKDVAEHANGLRKACEQVRPELRNVAYTTDRTRDLYRRLAARASPKDAIYLDHDSAQQLAWALTIVHEELRQSGATGANPDAKAIDAARLKLNEIVALNLSTKPRSPIGPRVGARQLEIQRFEFKPFTDSTYDLLRAFEAK